MEEIKMTNKTMYDRLTDIEREYIEQDGATKKDINESDSWDLIDFLTPLYKRYTNEWVELINRLTA